MTWKTPDCFESSSQIVKWHRAAARSVHQLSAEAEELRRSSFCTDCTPEYQQQMKSQGRCAYPGTTFSLDADGQIQGTRS